MSKAEKSIEVEAPVDVTVTYRCRPNQEITPEDKEYIRGRLEQGCSEGILIGDESGRSWWKKTSTEKLHYEN